MQDRKKEILEELKSHLEKEGEIQTIIQDVQNCKDSFVEVQSAQHEQEKEAFMEAGGSESAFKPSHDEMDAEFSDLMSKFNQRKKTFDDQRRDEQKQNLEAKKGIIDALQKLVEEEQNIAQAFNKFNELKEKWQNTGDIPPSEYRELQQQYSMTIEKFFYNINIYKTLKEYDLEKNFTLKKELISKIKLLHKQSSVKEMRELLNAYTKEWDEIGPTHQSKWEEVRDEFWTEVRSVQKKITDHYKGIKEQQKENLAKKESVCIKAEDLAKGEVKDLKGMNKMLRSLEELRTEWKQIGFAGKGKSDQLWTRFRKAGDDIYSKKKALQSGLKDVFKANEEKKLKIIERAESMKESMDWKKTADDYKRLQGDWKRVGSVEPHKEQKLWKRFRAATDTFFERRKAYFDGQEDREKNNLKEKKALLDTLEKSEKVDKAKLEEIGKQWNAIGMVPQAERRGLENKFNDALKKQFKSLGLKEEEVKKKTFKLKVDGLKQADNAEHLLRKEYQQLNDQLKKIEAQVQQYENNLGFFGGNVEGNPLVAEVQKNLESSKQEAQEIREKMAKLSE